MFEGIGGGFGAGMMGLGLVGDAFGAYSQMQAQKRQRDLYNQYQQQQQRMQNPAYMIGQAQPYYQANLNALQSSLPAFMRSTVNPMLGGRGIDPMGGIGQELTQQAIAPQLQNAWTQAMGQATGNNQMGLTALQGMGNNIGQPTGQMGGTSSALQSLMMLQALRGGQARPTGTMTDTSNMGGSDPYKFSQSSYGGSPLTQTGMPGEI